MSLSSGRMPVVVFGFSGCVLEPAALSEWFFRFVLRRVRLQSTIDHTEGSWLIANDMHPTVE